MTDFIVYISAQQRVQANLEDAPVPKPSRLRWTSRAVWPGAYAVRQHVSGALYRLAEAIQPVAKPAGAGLGTSV